MGADPMDCGRFVEALSRLPHGPPFRLVDDVHELDPGRSAWGSWTCAPDHPLLSGHFPGQPIVPGVLIIEALAQLAGLACIMQATASAGLAHADVRLVCPVVPPARIDLRATLERSFGVLHMVAVHATVDSKRVAKGTVTIGEGIV